MESFSNDLQKVQQYEAVEKAHELKVDLVVKHHKEKQSTLDS